MSLPSLIGFLVFAVLILVFGTVMAYFFVFLEHKVCARSQQRDGATRGGYGGLTQFLADYLKSWNKVGAVYRERRLFLSSAVLLVYLSLPYLFLGILFGGLRGMGNSSMIFLLLFLLAMSIAIEKFFLVFHASGADAVYTIRKHHVMSLAGITAFLLCLLVPAAGAEGGEFPHLFFLKNPAAFLAGIASFVAIYFIVNVHPVHADQSRGLHGAFHLNFFFAKRLWIFVLLSLWCSVFFGGPAKSAAEFLFFIPRVILLELVFLWIMSALPALRPDNAIEFSVKVLVPTSVVALILEICWMGFSWAW